VKTLADPSTRVQLCGSLAVEVCGRRAETALPGRQGRLLFAYLAVNRQRSVSRDELADALWGERPPAGADAALTVLLSKTRTALRPAEVQGRNELRLALPRDAWIDVEAALEAVHRAESAVEQGRWREAWGAALVARFVAARGFLAGHDAPWVEGWRRRLATSWSGRWRPTPRPASGWAGPSWPPPSGPPWNWSSGRRSGRAATGC
jgi:SARP family transcriptional regulator, regulator of embCAB operon